MRRGKQFWPFLTNWSDVAFKYEWIIFKAIMKQNGNIYEWEWEKWQSYMRNKAIENWTVSCLIFHVCVCLDKAQYHSGTLYRTQYYRRINLSDKYVAICIYYKYSRVICQLGHKHIMPSWGLKLRHVFTFLSFLFFKGNLL